MFSSNKDIKLINLNAYERLNNYRLCTLKAASALGCIFNIVFWPGISIPLHKSINLRTALIISTFGVLVNIAAVAFACYLYQSLKHQKNFIAAEKRIEADDLDKSVLSYTIKLISTSVFRTNDTETKEFTITPREIKPTSELSNLVINRQALLLDSYYAVPLRLICTSFINPDHQLGQHYYFILIPTAATALAMREGSFVLSRLSSAPLIALGDKPPIEINMPASYFNIAMNFLGSSDGTTISILNPIPKNTPSIS